MLGAIIMYFRPNMDNEYNNNQQLVSVGCVSGTNLTVVIIPLLFSSVIKYFKYKGVK